MTSSLGPWVALMLLALTVGLSRGQDASEPETAHRGSGPVVPGLHRDHPLDEEQVGRLLYEELRCAACHGNLPTSMGPVVPAPDLTRVGERVSAEYIQRFLLDPAAVQHGSRMPAVLGAGAPEDRSRVAEALTHFLVSSTQASTPPSPSNAEERARGRELFHSVGCIACHAPKVAALDGEELWPAPGAVDLEHVGRKYDAGALAQFLFQPGASRPAGRMPDMGLTRAEASAIAKYLIGAEEEGRGAFEAAPELVAAGRTYYEVLRCGSCHAPGTSVAAEAPDRLENLDAGCLSPEPSAAPDYSLTRPQRTALAAAIASPARDLSDAQRLAETMTRLNCSACHQRDDYGGVHPRLNPYFTTTEHELGDEARIPPTLTLVGAKLQPYWMHTVLFDKGRVRPYMQTRMPTYGAHELDQLPALFEALDSVEAFDVTPPTRENEREVRDAGRELLGFTGLSCVTCHDYNGKPAISFRGVDLGTSVDRLRPSWFARFMLDPQAFLPGTVMPQSWWDDTSSNKSILDGDPYAQVRAIWHYPSLGHTAGDPKGLQRSPSKLELAGEPRTYRGRSRVAGFRGIAVGFPEGIHYAFDANNGALSAVWKGEFVSARWESQGAGDFDPLAAPVQLPRDVAFLKAPDPDEPWPLRPVMDKENPVNPDPTYPRNLGYRFEGYHLDEARVPTLRYRCEDVSIEDRSVPDLSGDRAALVRSLRFSSAEPAALSFRVLSGDFSQLSEQELELGRLRILLPPTPQRIRSLPVIQDDAVAGSGEASLRELLLDLSLPKGTTTITLRYELQD